MTQPKFDPEKIDFMPDSFWIAFLPPGKSDEKLFINEATFTDEENFYEVSRDQVCKQFTPAEVGQVFNDYHEHTASNLPDRLKSKSGALMCIIPEG